MQTQTAFLALFLPIFSTLGAGIDEWDERSQPWRSHVPLTAPSTPFAPLQRVISKYLARTRGNHVAPTNATALEDAEGKARHGRFLSLFTVVRFDNTQCLSASGDNGTCYPQGECLRRGGAPTGKCAEGYGVCCVFSKSCSSKTFQNNTYFTHVGYPTAFDGTGSCQITIYKAAKDVCQFRLDFDSFNIAQPGTNGVCSNDQFIVSGTTSPIPIICGTNSGNHMYIDVGPDNSPVTMSVITSGPTFSRTWKVKVAQVRCAQENKAPEGCLQYFQRVSGTIRTYNFDFNVGQQLANQDYSSCIRTERNFCGIRYTTCPDSQAITIPATGDEGARQQRPRGFTISGTPTTNSLQGTTSCNMDWVIIPCATNTGRIIQQTGGATNVCQDRLCGGLFNSEVATAPSAVYSYVRPFRISYHTNGEETGDSMNRGYCLNFIQQPCTPTQ